jgi:biotin transport system ATP-binding protein
MTATGIRFEQVRVARGARTVLAVDHLTLGEARIGLIGANGSGKSTLLRCINGLVAPDEGKVTVDGLDVASDAKAVRRRVGFVFQDPEAQIVMPTVAEEIDLGLKARRLSRTERQERRERALAQFGLEGREDASAHLLSGGEKQRLALASIFALEPDVLVMDEPTAMLDLPGRRMFQRLIRPLPQRLLVATHDLELARDCARVLVVDGGRVVADAEADTAVAYYRDLVAARETGGEAPEAPAPEPAQIRARAS